MKQVLNAGKVQLRFLNEFQAIPTPYYVRMAKYYNGSLPSTWDLKDFYVVGHESPIFLFVTGEGQVNINGEDIGTDVMVKISDTNKITVQSDNKIYSFVVHVVRSQHAWSSEPIPESYSKSIRQNNDGWVFEEAGFFQIMFHNWHRTYDDSNADFQIKPHSFLQPEAPDNRSPTDLQLHLESLDNVSPLQAEAPDHSSPVYEAPSYDSGSSSYDSGSSSYDSSSYDSGSYDSGGGGFD